MLLDVGDGHRIHCEEHGSPTGKPVVVLHGGPGGGLQRSALKSFNLKVWRVIMFDQRGSGKSRPFLSLHKNTTWDLVGDIEKIRTAYGIATWTVFGGSWGSTLALAYASKHMDRIDALVLRGIFLSEPWEADWLYKEGGASRLYPEAFAAFVKGSHSNSHSRSNRNLTRSYRRLLRSRRTRSAAAKAWWKWESSLASLVPSKDTSTPSEILSLGVLENHYYSHTSWIRPGQLLAAAREIPKKIPVIIVQGRYDMICPAASAVALANAIPHAELHLTIAGHTASDPGNAKALKKTLQKLAVL